MYKFFHSYLHFYPPIICKNLENNYFLIQNSNETHSNDETTSKIIEIEAEKRIKSLEEEAEVPYTEEDFNAEVVDAQGKVLVVVCIKEQNSYEKFMLNRRLNRLQSLKNDTEFNSKIVVIELNGTDDPCKKVIQKYYSGDSFPVFLMFEDGQHLRSATDLKETFDFKNFTKSESFHRLLRGDQSPLPAEERALERSKIQ